MPRATRLDPRMIPNPQCRGVGGLGGPGFGIHNTIRGNAEANPEPWSMERVSLRVLEYRSRATNERDCCKLEAAV